MKELHESIRQLAVSRHVALARSAHLEEFCIAIRDLMQEAEKEGISTVQRAPAFCKSIQTKGFLKENGLSISRVDGPRSKLSTTVVVHYRMEGQQAASPSAQPQQPETPAEKAHRLTEKLRGLLKEELAEYGGGEAFLKWIRSEDDEAA